MKVTTNRRRTKLFNWMRSGMLLLAFACMMNEAGKAQSAAAKTDGAAVNDIDAPPVSLSPTATAGQRTDQAWKILTDAAGDVKRMQTQTRIQALAALSLLRCPRSAKMIVDVMTDPDVDIRTAAALAAGQTGDPNLTTNLRNLLDDKEPQVAFAAAMALWKMGDKSGEDILLAVVDAERSAGPTAMHGTEHKIDKDLHDPKMLAKLGVMQGASMFLGPFGYGITAFEFIHQSGGDMTRVAAIEQVSQEKTEPIHKELIAALADKDPAVRAAAAKALAGYHDQSTSNAIYPLFADKKYPVRLTAAAAYLRTTGTPGPLLPAIARGSRTGR